jgi:hypothetical protein
MKIKAAVVMAMLTGFWSFASAAIISGTVTDSANGSSLGQVYVSYGALATVTDSSGNFTLNTVVGIAQSPQLREKPQITWNPLHATFSWGGYPGEVTIRVINLQGLTVGHYSSGKHDGVSRYTLPKLPYGTYVAAISAGGGTGFHKILNLKGLSASQFQSIPLTNAGLVKAAVSAGADTLTFTRAYYKTATTVVIGDQSGMHVKMQRDSANSGVSAGVTDATGRVVFNLAGQSIAFRFADAYNVPAEGLLVGAQLNPDVPGMGVLMAAYPHDTRPPIIMVLCGAQGPLKKQISTKHADSTHIDIEVQVGSFVNSILEIKEIKSIPYLPGVKTFYSGIDILSQLGDMAKVINAIPGQPVSSALTAMGLGQTTIISADEALNEISISNITNSITSIILGGAATTAENPIGALHDVLVGAGLSLAGALFDKLTVYGCSGSISRLTTGPYTFYSCAMRQNPWDDLVNAPTIKVSAAGSSLMEFISKDIAGSGITAIPDQNGNADVPLYLGRYDLQVQGPSIDPATVKGVNITAAGGPIYVSTVSVGQGEFDGKWYGSFSGMYAFPDPSVHTNEHDTLEDKYLAIKGPIISDLSLGTGSANGTVDGTGTGTWTLRGVFISGALWTVPSAIYAFTGTFTAAGTASGTWTFTNAGDESGPPVSGNGTWSATRRQ